MTSSYWAGHGRKRKVASVVKHSKRFNLRVGRDIPVTLVPLSIVLLWGIGSKTGICLLAQY